MTYAHHCPTSPAPSCQSSDLSTSGDMIRWYDKNYPEGGSWIVVTTDPRGCAATRIAFFVSYEPAVEHARRMRRDLGRDAYVAPLKTAYYADRR